MVTALRAGIDLPTLRNSKEIKTAPNQVGAVLLFMVRKEGFEPSSLAAHAPQTCAYASSATSAKNRT